MSRGSSPPLNKERNHILTPPNKLGADQVLDITDRYDDLGFKTPTRQVKSCDSVTRVTRAPYRVQEHFVVSEVGNHVPVQDMYDKSDVEGVQKSIDFSSYLSERSQTYMSDPTYTTQFVKESRTVRTETTNE
jgi:hypothetical protein